MKTLARCPTALASDITYNEDDVRQQDSGISGMHSPPESVDKTRATGRLKLLIVSPNRTHVVYRKENRKS